MHREGKECRQQPKMRCLVLALSFELIPVYQSRSNAPWLMSGSGNRDVRKRIAPPRCTLQGCFPSKDALPEVLWVGGGGGGVAGGIQRPGPPALCLLHDLTAQPKQARHGRGGSGPALRLRHGAAHRAWLRAKGGTRTVSRELSGTMRGRKDRECGLMGVMSVHGTDGATMDPARGGGWVVQRG